MRPARAKTSESRGKIAFFYRGYENIGIQSLSAVLKKAGFSTRLFFDPELFDDWILRVPSLIRTFDFSEYVLSEALAWKPDLALFSVVTYDYTWAKQIASKLKSRSGVPVVFGGIHATSAPEEILENPFVDFVVQGEGEGCIERLAEHLFDGKSGEGIPNLWYRKDGKIVRPDRLADLIQDLDALPFADKELHYNASEHFRIGYTILSGRGCPNNCTYCHNNVQKKIYPLKGYMRRRTPENVVVELEEAHRRYGFDLVRFSDDNFCYDPDWLESFAALYARRVGVPFWIFLDPRTSSERVIRSLKHAGCAEVEMGVQTLDPHVRSEVIWRRETEDEIKGAIRGLREAGIRCSTDFIINLPGHDEPALVNAIRFFKKHTPSRVNTFWINYYPGLDITRLAVEEDLLAPDVKEAICRGEGVHTFFQGGSVYNAQLAKLQILFTLLQVLPEGPLEKILRYKVYRRIPFFGFKVTYFLMYMLSYLNTEEKNDLYLRRLRRRYRKYMLLRIRKPGRFRSPETSLSEES